MASYQEIETRLNVVEDKLDFMMKAFAVSRTYEHPLVPGQMIRETMTMLDQYRQMKGLGLTPEEVTAKVPEPETISVEQPQENN